MSLEMRNVEAHPPMFVQQMTLQWLSSEGTSRLFQGLCNVMVLGVTGCNEDTTH